MRDFLLRSTAGVMPQHEPRAPRNETSTTGDAQAARRTLYWLAPDPERRMPAIIFRDHYGSLFEIF